MFLLIIIIVYSFFHGGSVGVVSSCGSNNIFYNDPGALQITSQLCACPTVRDLLASFGDKVSIDVKTGDSPQIRAGFVDAKNAKRPGSNAEIHFPERTVKQRETVGHATFELFNVKHRIDMESLWNRAQNGDVDMNPYATAFEKIEFKARDEALDLSLECNFITQTDMKDTTRDLLIHLWNKVFDCHTDKFKERWIQHFQKAFCQKHPEKQFCKMRVEGLCNYYEVVNMPEEKQYLFKVNRICERLHKLPQKVKDWWPAEVEYCQYRDLLAEL